MSADIHRQPDELSQARPEAARWRELAWRFRETVDDGTWEELLREHGLHEEGGREPAGPAGYRCVVCGVNAITPELGEDTCAACLSRV